MILLTFFSKKMELRKITIDNSVKKIPTMNKQETEILK